MSKVKINTTEEECSGNCTLTKSDATHELGYTFDEAEDICGGIEHMVTFEDVGCDGWEENCNEWAV